MGQLGIIRTATGAQYRAEDWTASPLYSTVDIDDAAALTRLDAFSYGKGGEIPGSVAAAGTAQRTATLKDTNVEGAGGILAENEELMLFGLCVELIQRYSSLTDFFNGNETWCPDPPLVSFTNVLRVQQDTVVRLMIANTKDYHAVPIGALPAARGVNHVFGSARSQGSAYAEGMVVGSNGGVNEHTHRRFGTPHEVGPGEAFSVRFEFPRGSVANLDFGADTRARISARVWTRGLRRRPVA
ncbi:MAG: hypothetical protein NUW01_05170 [Gemmatimonadaceae bacterium]|nr:hypothetical protein [Gemmatimonadaceae bacterium]